LHGFSGADRGGGTLYLWLSVARAPPRRSTALRYVPMNLSSEQFARVRYLLDDRWETWEDFDRTLAMMSAEELHEYADRFDWDAGEAVERLTRVLKHPNCDRGTALMIYWRADPVFDLEYGTRERLEAEEGERVNVYDLTRYIEKRLADDSFATARIPYDPQNDRGKDRTKPKKPRAWQLEERDGQIVRVDIQPPPEAPKIDVRALLPAVVFEPVQAGRPGGT